MTYPQFWCLPVRLRLPKNNSDTKSLNFHKTVSFKLLFIRALARWQKFSLFFKVFYDRSFLFNSHVARRHESGSLPSISSLSTFKFSPPRYESIVSVTTLFLSLNPARSARCLNLYYCRNRSMLSIHVDLIRLHDCCTKENAKNVTTTNEGELCARLY